MTTPTAKKQILFVDDDPSILAGLQNLLYKDRRRWDMAFAPSGEAALEKLRTQTYDVVVSDMRMPGMDGATLLHRVKDASPATARIMLSGHADREAIVRALPALHQLLAKPCDAATLRATIERSLETRATIRDANVRSVIGRIDKLPSPPLICDQLAAVLGSPSSTLDELAAVVARDPGLSAKVLQLVNSAYFGCGQRTSSIREAVSLLGAEQLRYIGVTASVFGAMTEDPFPEFSLRDSQEHALRTAGLVRMFAKGALAEEAFAGALLHDVGSIVLAFGFPVEYREVITRVQRTGASLAAVETEAFGTSHAEVGACLLGLWGLPAPILDIVRYHHHPDGAPAETRSVASAVHVAEAWSYEPPGQLDLAALAAAGCASMVSIWGELAGAVP
jgi:HD-like signal output (HDOD) protein